MNTKRKESGRRPNGLVLKAIALAQLSVSLLLGTGISAKADGVRILCDKSGSMAQSDEARLRLPGLHLLLSILALDERHEVGVRFFDDRVQEAIAPRALNVAGIEEIFAALSWPADGGGTALSAGINSVLEEKLPLRDVIVFSDGQFESSDITMLREQMERLKAAGVRFSAIGLSARSENTLAEMAKATGGAYFNLDSRTPRTPTDWEVVILRLVFCLYPPDLYVIGGSHGTPLNRFIQRGLFIGPAHCTVTAPDGRVVCRAGSLKGFPNTRLIPNDKWTLLAVKQEGENLEGHWQFADERGHPVNAAFVGASAVDIALRNAPPAEPASDDMVAIAFDVSAEPAALQKMTPETRMRFHTDGVIYGQEGGSSHVSSTPVRLSEVKQRVNQEISLWPLTGPADLDVSMQHPDLPGCVASMRLPVTIQPSRFAYDFQTSAAKAGAAAWRAADPTQNISVRQDQKLSFRAKPTRKTVGEASLGGTLRLLEGDRVVQKQSLSVNGDELLASLDLHAVTPGLYNVEVSISGVESLTGAIPIFDAIGSSHTKTHSRAIFRLQVGDAPPPPLVVTSSLEMPSSLRQGSPLLGTYRVRVAGGSPSERAAVEVELRQCSPKVRLIFNSSGNGREIDIRAGPLLERKGAGNDREYESAIESRGCQYLGHYTLHSEALFLAQARTTLTEREADLEVGSGLVQCIVVRENGVGPGRGLLDSFQPSFQNSGHAFVGDQIYLEVRRSAACEKPLFIGLQKGLQLWFVQNGVQERVPIELKDNKYVSGKSRLNSAGNFEFRVSIPIGGEEFTLTGRAIIVEPVVKLTAAAPERFPPFVPEGALMPLTVHAACDADDPQDAEAILQRHSLTCEVLDSRSEVITSERCALHSTNRDWSTVLCLAQRGQQTVRVRLHREGRNIQEIAFPVEVGAAPIAFVGADDQPFATSREPSFARGWVEHLLMTPRPVTVKAVPVMSSPFWGNYVPQLMRVRTGTGVLEKKYDAEQLVWDISPPRASGPWAGEVLLTPASRRSQFADLPLRYPLVPVVKYALSGSKVVLAAIVLGGVIAFACLGFAGWNRRRLADAAMVMLSQAAAAPREGGNASAITVAETEAVTRPVRRKLNQSLFE
jgi:hypothetical protein